MGNYTQISWETGLVTETADVVDKAGREKELNLQKLKRGLELKRDIEYSILINSASVAGNDTTARKAGSFPAWLTSNDDRVRESHLDAQRQSPIPINEFFDVGGSLMEGPGFGDNIAELANCRCVLLPFLQKR